MKDKDIIKAFNSLYTKLLDVKYDLKITHKEFLALNEVHNLITRQQAIVEKSEKVEYFADKTIATLQAEIKKLQNFKSYFDFYYGSDIEMLGLNEDGNTTYYDEFYNCAIANGECTEHHIAHIIKKAKSEAYKECIEKVKKEISEALKSNYKARAEREQKIPIYTETEFLSYCSGKIDCLRGIDDFLDNLIKEMVGENNG